MAGDNCRPRSGPRAPVRRCGRAAQPGRCDDGRPDLEELAGMRADPSSARLARRQLRPLVRVLSGVLPLACHVPHRPVRAQPRGDGPLPPDGGYGRFDKSNALPVWLQRAGYHTAHLGKFLNGYGTRSRRTCRRDGATGTRPSTTPPTTCGGTRSTTTADEDLRPSLRRGPPALPDGRAGGQGGSDREAAARAAQAAVPVGQLPGAASRERAIQRRTGTLVRPAPRYRGAFRQHADRARSQLQRVGHVGQATLPRERHAPADGGRHRRDRRDARARRARAAGRGRRGGTDRQGPAGGRRARRDVHHLHQRQRLHAG